MPVSTISGILTRIGMGKLGRLGLEPVERYERERPGELIHIDVTKLGRINGGAGHRMTGRRHYTPRLMDAAGRRRGIAQPSVASRGSDTLGPGGRQVRCPGVASANEPAPR